MILHRCSRNLPQDLRNSSTALKTAKEICIGASDKPNRNRRNNSSLLKQLMCSANKTNYFEFQDQLNDF